jgi:predicted membrane chloride channel (bestrophin family)
MCPWFTVTESGLNLILTLKPAIQIPAARASGTTTIKTAASVSPDTILNTAINISKGAAKIMTQPLPMAYRLAITIFGLALWFHMAAPPPSSA